MDKGKRADSAIIKVPGKILKSPRDAVFLTFFVKQMQTSESTAILTIKNVCATDCAVYAARAENRGGIAKCSANLVLEGEYFSPLEFWTNVTYFFAEPIKTTKAPTFTKTIQPVSGASVGQLIRLDAKIASASPLQVKWFRDGEEITPDITHKVITEGDMHTLLILEASPMDRGVYECVAKSKTGESRCRTTVDIKPVEGRRRSSASARAVAPEILQPLQSLVAEEGKPVSFSANVSQVNSKSTLNRSPSILTSRSQVRVSCGEKTVTR